MKKFVCGKYLPACMRVVKIPQLLTHIKPEPV